MAGICNAICSSASTAGSTWFGWILIEEFSKGGIQAMKPKTLTIQLNDEQLPILPVEPEAHLSFTTHADGNELELTGNRAGLLLLAKAALGMAETVREDGFHMLIDTVGMSTLLLPDLQYHFHGMDPNWVVNHAYNVASYILEHDNPIQDGETIDGVADGQMCREIQWKCQYEDALIQPPRGVLDINMGKYASGGR